MKGTKDNILPVLKEESEKLYIANKNKNAASAEERKHQAEMDYLLSDIYEGKEGGFDHAFKYNEREVYIHVSYEQKATDAINVRKLYDEVGLETFLKCCTPSKSQVERICGKNVTNKCVTTKLSDFKTRIKET